jgi:hypothetical protein
MAEVTQGDAIAAVTDEGGSAAGKILGDIFQHNAREQQWLAQAIGEGLEQQRDEWKARALAAEERLARIEDRIYSMLD